MFFAFIPIFSAASVSRRRNRRQRRFSVARKRFGSRGRAGAVDRRLRSWRLAGVVSRRSRSRWRGRERRVGVVRWRVEEAGAGLGDGVSGFAAAVEATEPLPPHPQRRAHASGDRPQLLLLVVHRGLQPLPGGAQSGHLLLLGAALGLQLQRQLFDLPLFVHGVGGGRGLPPALFQELVAAVLVGLSGRGGLLRCAGFELLQLFGEARRLPLQLDRGLRDLITRARNC